MIQGGIVGGYYGSGSGDGAGGGITQAALNRALNTLRSALQTAIDAKADETSVVSRLQVKANATTVTALGRTLRAERAGVLLNETAQQTVQNLNTTRTDTQVIDDIGFSVLPIFRDELDDYDRFLMEVSELGSDGSTVIDSTSIAFTFAVWDSLKEVSIPSGSSFVAAHTNDNRALRWAWHDNPPAEVTIRSGSGQANRIRTAVEQLSDNIRSSSRVLYVGKSVADTTANVAQRMLIAITGIKNNFRCRVYGYRGA